jgi:Domain of unknown function (DUF4160)
MQLLLDESVPGRLRRALISQSFATVSSGCSRTHVHVAQPDGEAKFWLTPEIAVAMSTGVSPGQLRDAQAIVEAHIREIQDAWHRHFGT